MGSSSHPQLPPPPPATRRSTSQAAVPQVAAAQALTAQVAERLQGTPAFRKLPPSSQQALVRDLLSISQALGTHPRGPYATPQETPADLARLRAAARGGSSGNGDTSLEEQTTPQTGAKPSATEAFAKKVGSLSDEVDFPAFVAGLVHGTFDAIVDSAIRQMESFAELVSVIARDSQSFTRDNVTANQARDWLVSRFPQDLQLDLKDAETGLPVLRPKLAQPDEEPSSPAWLADFGLEGQQLSEELIEEQLVPIARQRVGDSRLQMLATMVLLGLNRIVVKDGSITARVRFRTAARDTSKVDFAVGQDPAASASGWGSRGSNAYVTHDTKISTVGVNVQADTELKVELFGEVRINFASETLPLDRFVDQARLTLLQNHSRPVTSLIANAAAPGTNAPAAETPATPPSTPPPPTPGPTR